MHGTKLHEAWTRNTQHGHGDKSSITPGFQLIILLIRMCTWQLSAMASLAYSPLDAEEKEIRLLELLPGRWTDPIACELSTVSLCGDPCYDALSYVWGNPKDTLPITVGGKPFQATTTVRSALRRLRSYQDSRTLWVDAICINQEDREEKTQQVMLMRHIYSSAKSVQVYLGEGPILDAIPLEEQATWNQPPQIHWHRDLTVLLMSAEQAHWTVVRSQWQL
jgi:heterokaryon incompatibility protein (HET)